mgnify:CR=1 FL=1
MAKTHQIILSSDYRIATNILKIDDDVLDYKLDRPCFGATRRAKIHTIDGPAIMLYGTDIQESWADPRYKEFVSYIGKFVRPLTECDDDFRRSHPSLYKIGNAYRLENRLYALGDKVPKDFFYDEDYTLRENIEHNVESSAVAYKSMNTLPPHVRSNYPSKTKYHSLLVLYEINELPEVYDAQ